MELDRKKISFVLAAMTLLSSGGVLSSPLKTEIIQVQQWPSSLYSLNLRIGTQSPIGAPVGDIFYLPGFADRIDNHASLFAAWNRLGFRVISFDYPSQGETTGTSLNLFSFRRLAAIAKLVEQRTRENINRPLILAGWSTGGLLAVRMVQAMTFSRLERSPIGLILFSPGISVRNIIGKPSLRYPLGEVTLSTLTNNQNPPYYGEIKPKSPGLTPVFAVNLKLNSLLSLFQTVPRNIPIYIFHGEEKLDRYVDLRGVKRWARWQNRWNDAQIKIIKILGAKHELDNEPGNQGAVLRNMASHAAFLFYSSYLQAGASSCQKPLTQE